MTENIVEQSYNTTGSHNLGYNQAGALQIRLETSSIIEQIEQFLTGTKIIYYKDDTEELRSKRQSIGQSKCNELGIQSILTYVGNIINPATVQGNFPADRTGVSHMYENYVCWVRQDFAYFVAINCEIWQLNDNEQDFIIDSIMNLIEPYMTRLIENKERESYAQTIQHREVSSVSEKGGIKDFFKT